MVSDGLYNVFMQAGAVFSAPTCGSCLGGYMGILAPGEVCISSTNRNFRGRMGHPDSLVYLASPKTVAASALAGHIQGAEK
jgi:3-isopropylmalate/(R)-2-methylmalate dehydratase large subunit